ncbi:hypothetical protein [Pantoea stewartii]|uniref:hypothetical protein n=1 Tax=Pantoea stewartii TaxID=66269 RepID=UPI0036310176
MASGAKNTQPTDDIDEWADADSEKIRREGDGHYLHDLELEAFKLDTSLEGAIIFPT